MLRSIRRWLHQRRQQLFQLWLDRRIPPEPRQVRLGRRRLYILPTHLGWIFAALVLTLLIGSLNYETSLGFGVTFLLAGLGLTGMIRTYRNLRGLALRFGPAPAVFAGDTAHFPVFIEGEGLERWAVQLGDTTIDHVAAHTGLATAVPLPAPLRGRRPLPRTTVATTWPLGLYRVWSWAHPRVDVLVYPRPVDHGQPLPEQRTGGDGKARARQGDDEFAGLREYMPGDPPRRIEWKAYARRDQLQVKLYEAEASGDRVLDWFALGQLDTEARLEQLTHWVLMAEDRGERYALNLPGCVLDAGSGVEHRRECLAALALHGGGRS